MISTTRSIRIAGDPRAAMASAVQFVEHMRTWQGVTSSECYMTHGGPTGTLIFVNTVPDMTTLDAVFSAMNTDETYWGMIKTVTDAGLFDMASATDNILRKLT
jgi:hypothetical protein